MKRHRTFLFAAPLFAVLMSGCDDLKTNAPPRPVGNPGGVIADPFAVENAGREDRPSPPPKATKAP